MYRRQPTRFSSDRRCVHTNVRVTDRCARQWRYECVVSKVHVSYSGSTPPSRYERFAIHLDSTEKRRRHPNFDGFHINSERRVPPPPRSRLTTLCRFSRYSQRFKFKPTPFSFALSSSLISSLVLILLLSFCSFSRWCVQTGKADSEALLFVRRVLAHT